MPVQHLMALAHELVGQLSRRPSCFRVVEGPGLQDTRPRVCQSHGEGAVTLIGGIAVVDLPGERARGPVDHEAGTMTERVPELELGAVELDLRLDRRRQLPRLGVAEVAADAPVDDRPVRVDGPEVGAPGEIAVPYLEAGTVRLERSAPG